MGVALHQECSNWWLMFSPLATAYRGSPLWGSAGAHMGCREWNMPCPKLLRPSSKLNMTPRKEPPAELAALWRDPERTPPSRWVPAGSRLEACSRNRSCGCS